MASKYVHYVHGDEQGVIELEFVTRVVKSEGVISVYQVSPNEPKNFPETNSSAIGIWEYFKSKSTKDNIN